MLVNNIKYCCKKLELKELRAIQVFECRDGGDFAGRLGTWSLDC